MLPVQNCDLRGAVVGAKCKAQCAFVHTTAMRTHYCIHMGDCLNPAFILITDKLSVFACACLASTKQNLMHLMHFVGFQLTRFHENENGLASCPEAQKQTRSKAGKPVLRQSAQLMIMVLNWHECIFRQVAGQRQHAIKISTQV